MIDALMGYVSENGRLVAGLLLIPWVFLFLAYAGSEVGLIAYLRERHRKRRQKHLPRTEDDR